MALGPVIEPLSVIFFTILLCLMSFEVIRRIDILKPLFGVRIKKNYSNTTKNIAYGFGCLLIIPIGLEIIL